MNVTRDDYVAATNTAYMYTCIHIYTHARTHTHARMYTYIRENTRVHCRSNTREKEQPAVRMIRSKRTYLQTRNHKDMHHVYATLETILPDLSLFNYFGCILKCN